MNYITKNIQIMYIYFNTCIQWKLFILNSYNNFNNL